ncbi:MAG: hypothetical protein ABIY55_01775 [Kofleriaceae bacterium]
MLIAALTGLAGCDMASPATQDRASAASAAAQTQSFVARPRQHLLFTAKPSASPAEVEAYYKANILPAVIRDRRIGEVAVSIDRNGQYLVELELRTATAGDLSLALEVLSLGKTTSEGEQILDGFAKYFDVSNAQQLTPRADLSISRSVVGSIEGVSP